MPEGEGGVNAKLATWTVCVAADAGAASPKRLSPRMVRTASDRVIERLSARMPVVSIAIWDHFAHIGPYNRQTGTLAEDGCDSAEAAGLSADFRPRRSRHPHLLSSPWSSAWA